jgi:hypothetical protein
MKGKSRICVVTSVALRRVALGLKPRSRAGEHLLLEKILIRQFLIF